MSEKKADGFPAEEERNPVLRLYNSMSKEKEVFQPIEEGKVRMYVCGVTPYDFSHVGHARAYVAFDVLHRYLKHLGYEVIYVRNFTDIDDKIIKRANEASEDPLGLSERFSNEFLHDMDELQCLPPTHQPKVSEHLDQIKDMISKVVAHVEVHNERSCVCPMERCSSLNIIISVHTISYSMKIGPHCL